MGSGPTTVAGATPTRMLRSFTCTRGMNGGGSATNALSSFWSRTLLVFFAMAPATVPRAPRNERVVQLNIGLHLPMAYGGLCIC